MELLIWIKTDAPIDRSGLVSSLIGCDRRLTDQSEITYSVPITFTSMMVHITHQSVVEPCASLLTAIILGQA